jgi:hypothetical protein
MVVLPDVVVPADTFKAGRTDKAREDQIANLPLMVDTGQEPWP